MDVFNKALMFNGIRKAFCYSDFHKAIIDAVSEGRGRNKCQVCQEFFPKKDLHVDHIDPVVPLEGIPDLDNGLPDLNTYAARVFFNKCQAICIGCHKLKTRIENEQRRKIKAANKTTKQKTRKKQK